MIDDLDWGGDRYHEPRPFLRPALGDVVMVGAWVSLNEEILRDAGLWPRWLDPDPSPFPLLRLFSWWPTR